MNIQAAQLMAQVGDLQGTIKKLAFANNNTVKKVGELDARVRSLEVEIRQIAKALYSIADTVDSIADHCGTTIKTAGRLTFPPPPSLLHRG